MASIIPFSYLKDTSKTSVFRALVLIGFIILAPTPSRFVIDGTATRPPPIHARPTIEG